MSTNESIDKTRKAFESSFSEKKYYDIQTYDDEHLNRIMGALDIQDDFQVMDLGTGNGFLAFPLAERFPESKIVGLDIVPQTLEHNEDRAKIRNIPNVKFICYDGIKFPFEDDTFDVVVTRYCLHHFPDIKTTFAEIARVLKPCGQLFISDPTPDENDSSRFVDAYMQLKNDGHVKFYSKEEFDLMAGQAGMDFEKNFDTLIRFPRKDVEAYLKISKDIPENVIDSYNIKVTDGEVYITERVLNVSYRKSAAG